MALAHRTENSPEEIIAEIKIAKTSIDLFLEIGLAIEIEEKNLKKGSLEEITSPHLDYKIAKKLIKEAREGRDYSYAPYSHFNVGASILARNKNSKESTFYGCNIENSAYGSTNCGERTAAFKAVSEGCRKFSACAVVGGFDCSMPKELREEVEDDYIPPCGACRQVLNEFREDPFYIILAKDSGKVLIIEHEFILPMAFGPKSLGIDASAYDRHNKF